MKIWLLMADEKCMGVNFHNKDLSLSIFDSKKIELPIIQLNTYKKGRYSDIVYLFDGAPVLNIKTVECLKDLLLNQVQIIPTEVVNQSIQLTLIHVINVIDAVDYDKSTAIRDSFGNVLNYTWYSFDYELIKDFHIFKIPQSSTKVFVSDAFRDRVITNKLKGFEFQEVWDSARTSDVV